MNKKRYITLIGISCLLMVQQVKAQDIWPGDANNNGIVNAVDLLYLGVAFGSEGPARFEVSSEWAAQPFPGFWAEDFPMGINYVFADCNGNGLVGEDDYEDGVEENFGLTHGLLLPDGYANAPSGTAPRLRLQPDATVVGEGAMVNISLSLDDSDMPLNDFYGLAFTLSYSTGLLAGEDAFEFDFTEDGWITADNSSALELFVDNDGQGQAQLAVTRTNQEAIAASSDAIGNFSIVIEDIIVGLSVDTLMIRIDSILLIDAELNARPATPDSVEIIVAKDPILVKTGNESSEPPIQLFPNPAADNFYLRTNTPLKDLRLFDQLGKNYPLGIYPQEEGLYRIQPPPDISAGLYYLSGRSPEGAFFKKVMVL